MEDHRSKQMEVAAEIGHIAARLSLQFDEDQMWKEENEDMVYATEEIQDSFNEFYDDFDTIITKAFPEPKAYLLDAALVEKDELIPDNIAFEKEQFKAKAENAGTVYSVEGFVKEANKGDSSAINLSTHFLIID